MTPERPPPRSERLLRSTLERNPPQALVSPSSSPRAHRRRHSHVPPSTTNSTSISAENDDDDDDDDDQFFRAAFLYRTAATASSPGRPQYSSSRRHGQRTSNSSSPTRDYYSHDSRSRSRATSPSYHQYPRAHSPSPRRLSLQRSPASVDGHYMSTNLQRHYSIPARRRSNVTSIEPQTFPLTPHEQVLRARLERVLISGRVVDEGERSREHMSHGRRSSREDCMSSGWPWSDHSGLASTPPKSASSSDHGHPTQSYPTHHRFRSKTDPLTSPSLLPTTFTSPRRATTSSPYFPSKPTSAPGPAQRNNSNSSSWTPPLTADTSPILSEPLDHSLPGEEDADVDSRLLLTPPPTPPLYGTFSATATPTPAAVVGNGSATATPGSISTTKYPPSLSTYRSRTRESSDRCPTSSPYLYQGCGVDGSVEQLDLSLTAHPHHETFNARKASERCRMMEGYVSFAQVEGLGMPPDGVDDEDDTGDRKAMGEGAEGKRGRVLSVNIGTWARKLFVGVQAAAAAQS